MEEATPEGNVIDRAVVFAFKLKAETCGIDGFA
jgi:hypothetical protein